MKRCLFSFLLSVFSFFANAGYYVTVTGVTGDTSSGSFPVGKTSTCYLLPSMAISSISPSVSRTVVTALDKAGTFAFTYAGVTFVSGTFGACDVEPAVTSLPLYAGGITDPAISGASVLSGSSGGSGGTCSGGTATAADIALLGIDAENILYVWTWGFGSVVLMWFFGFAIGAGKTAIRKV